MFTICLGKNGGFFQIGGYNAEKYLEPLSWNKMLAGNHNYKFEIKKTWINNHSISHSESWSVAFLDTGTTFSYLPSDMWDSLIIHIDSFCENAKENHP